MQISRDHIIFGLIALTLVFLLAGGFLVLYVMLYNTRKKKHLQETEWMRQRFVQELALTKMEVQEQTLQTIARDIHDNVGQLLSITKITLSAIDISQAENATEKLDAASGLLDKSIKELRQLASILHAPNLLAAGLERAIENELNWLSRSGKFAVDWSVEGSQGERINSERQLMAFRIIQELLNNIIRHAEASRVIAGIRYLEKSVLITVSDNGRGFDVARALQDPKGLGIANFFNRARMIAGDFRLDSAPGSGTNATLELPYD